MPEKALLICCRLNVQLPESEPAMAFWKGPAPSHGSGRSWGEQEAAGMTLVPIPLAASSVIQGQDFIHLSMPSNTSLPNCCLRQVAPTSLLPLSKRSVILLLRFTEPMTNVPCGILRTTSPIGSSSMLHGAARLSTPNGTCAIKSLQYESFGSDGTSGHSHAPTSPTQVPSQCCAVTIVGLGLQDYEVFVFSSSCCCPCRAPLLNVLLEHALASLQCPHYHCIAIQCRASIWGPHGSHVQTTKDSGVLKMWDPFGWSCFP